MSKQAAFELIRRNMWHVSVSRKITLYCDPKLLVSEDSLIVTLKVTVGVVGNVD